MRAQIHPSHFIQMCCQSLLSHLSVIQKSLYGFMFASLRKRAEIYIYEAHSRSLGRNYSSAGDNSEK